MKFWREIPADVLIAYVVGISCLLFAAWGFWRKTSDGDRVQEWLEASDEPRLERPWTLPAAKGLHRNGRRVVPFERKQVRW